MISELGRKKIEYLIDLGLRDLDNKPWARRAATDKDIDEVNTSFADFELTGTNVPTLPEDYAEFLKINDGYEENGMRFFGTKNLVFDSRYALSSLYERNAYYHENLIGLSNSLVIGEFDDDIYLYSAEDGKYYSADCDTLVAIDEYDSFENLFIWEAGQLLFSTRDGEEEKFDSLFSEGREE